jgi:Domain of unknown function (DUF4314)
LIFYSKVGEHPLIGKRIPLSFTSDPYTHLKDGDLGTVTDINELKEFTQIGVKWDNGLRLMLIQDKDKFEIINLHPSQKITYTI